VTGANAETRGETRRRHRLAALVLVLAAVAGIAWGLRGLVPIEASAGAVRGFVDGLGWWGPPVFVGLFAFRAVLMLPSVVLLVAGGVCFGVLGGAMLGGLGLTVSAGLKWAILQLAGRERLRAALPARLRRRLAASDGPAGAGVLAVATAYPVGPGELLHTAAILAGMPVVPFLLAVAGGSLVRAGSFSLFGGALTEGHGLATAVAVLSAIAVLPLFAPRVRRALRGAGGAGSN
jgi:uncharacterized membrane protein YdjX (TVP38/TMEM64 family)